MPLLHADVGHQDVIDSLVFSPSGRQILSGSWDGTAKLWDVRSGALLRTFSWGGSQVRGVAWSPDGTILAIASWPPDARLGEDELRSYQAYFEHRDQSFLEALSDDDDGPTEEVRLFESESGRFIRSIADRGSGVAFSPDGQSLAVVSWNSLSIIDVASGECTAEYDRIEKSALRNVFFSQDGKQVGCVDSNGVLVFDAITASPQFVATDKCLFSDSDNVEYGFRLAHLPNAADDVSPEDEAAHLSDFWRRLLPKFRPIHSSDSGMSNQRIAFSPTGDLEAIHQQRGFRRRPPFGSTLAGVTILERSSGRTTHFIPSPNQKWLRTTAFSPDGKRLAGTGDHQTIFLWDVESGNELLRIGQPPPPITALAFARSESVVAAGAMDGTLLLYDIEKKEVVGFSQHQKSPIAHLEFSNDDETLVVGRVDGRVQVCRLPSLTPLVECRPHDERLVGGMVSADGQRFVSVGYDIEPVHRKDKGKPATVVVSRLSDGRELASEALPDVYPINSIAASPGREQLAASYWELVVTVDVSNGVDVRRYLQLSKADFARVAFSPIAPTMLVANAGYGMKLMSGEPPTAIRSFVATRDGPTCFAFSHDGTYVARSTAYHRDIELFEVSSGLLKRVFLGHQAAVGAVAVSMDDKHLASGGKDGTLKIWDMDSGDLKASIVARADEVDGSQPWECLIKDQPFGRF